MNRGNIVRFQRQRAGLSVAELAERSELSLEVVEDIEGNLRRPKTHELDAMATAMELPYWSLREENPVDQRVHISAHGSNVYDENGQLTPQAEPVSERLIEMLEMDEYLSETLDTYR